MSDTADNPLLETAGLPAWHRIRAEHVEPAIREVLAELAERVDRLEEALGEGAEVRWEAVVEPLERLVDRLDRPWGAVLHLMGVRNSDALREAHRAVQGDVVSFGLRVGQSPTIFRALTALKESPAWSKFESAQRRIVEDLLRRAEHAGVGLEGEARERFNAIQAELAQLSTEFTNHVLDATKAFSLTLREESEVEGLPESARQLAAQSAREAGETRASAEAGPWRITLDAPSFRPFMEHARRRSLREQLYRAYVTRAGDGKLDNSPLIDKILCLRAEESRLLGYANFAELSLSSKMATGVAAVEQLLEQLRDASLGAAQRELDELSHFAREHPECSQSEELALWDVMFWAERLREDRYAYSEEELRPWFPLPVVLEGLFDLTQRLFGVSVEEADGKAPVWHEDVRFFSVRDAQGLEIARFYLDAYSRPGEKNGGAWMNECVGRSRLLAEGQEACRLPVAHVVCNQAPPVDGKPSLMSFLEVQTLFHEFGHSLQHMLTTVDFGLAAGVANVEWDAVELASQFMENWCYQRDTVRRISSHVDTGEALPEALFEKLEAARTYRSGSDTLRQLYFAFTDLALHADFDPEGEETAFAVQRRISKRTTVMPPLPEDRFLCSFSHIFAGGYAAGYYSYKWAEVLSADAFAAFEEAGLDDAQALAETGLRYRDTVLALGGSEHPMQVFERFRGRPPSPEALLRHTGLAGAH
ncbi:MAG: M3 family metallopeptidase [Myxococcota bacterium]|nr:M3 family metallopeptidase [Myxococcota bacterium]